jgi:transposase
VSLPSQLQQVHLDAAGIDVGSEFHMVAVPSDRDEQPVRKFEAFTADLEALADWLSRCGIETVAMESTGVYWIPLFELLESRGFQVLLVDPRRLKSVPGRKTDVLDCQWIQQLHTFGLLSGAFRPAEQVCVLRAYMRQRAMLVQYGAQHIQHIQKALQQMNVKLDKVLSDITGRTGLAILEAILAGERDPLKLAQLRHVQCKNDEATIAKALQGNWRDDYRDLFDLHPDNTFLIKVAYWLNK